MTFSNKNPFVFPAMKVSEIGAKLEQELPTHVKIKLKNGKNPEIKIINIVEGKWKEASMFIDCSSSQKRLVDIQYRIPNFISRVYLFIASIALLSIIITVMATLIIGKFVPAYTGLGGAAGFGIYTILEYIIINNMKNNWSIELKQAIENINA